MTRDMTKGNIISHILLYSLPMLAGNLFTQLYNAADCMIVGSINGKEALAAIGAAGPVMNILLFLSLEFPWEVPFSCPITMVQAD